MPASGTPRQQGRDDPEVVAKLAVLIQRLSSRILMDSLNVRADISKALCYDVALHWLHDIERLRRDGDDTIRPAKHVAYMAFWFRKLKPLSNAYHLRDILQAGAHPAPPTREILNVNERVAIWIAFEQLSDFAEAGNLVLCGTPDTVYPYDPEKFRKAVERYRNQKLGPQGKTVLEALLYDMRYKAFGPQHLVHIFDQFVFNLFH